MANNPVESLLGEDQDGVPEVGGGDDVLIEEPIHPTGILNGEATPKTRLRNKDVTRGRCYFVPC